MRENQGDGNERENVEQDQGIGELLICEVNSVSSGDSNMAFTDQLGFFLLLLWCADSCSMAWRLR